MPRRTRFRAAAACQLAAAFAAGMTGCTQYYVYGPDRGYPSMGAPIVRYKNGQVCEVPTIVDGGVVVMEEPAIDREVVVQSGERPIARRDPIVSTPRSRIARSVGDGWRRADVETIVEGGQDDIIRE